MHDPELIPLSVASLIVDPEVQRVLDQARVKAIADAFNPDALGTIEVSRRSNGSYHIIDGQHRAAAVRLVLGDDAKVLCRVFSGLSLSEEAEMFRLFNNTKRPQAFDIFRTRIIEGDPVAVNIRRILLTSGWTLGLGNPPGFAAVASAERIFRVDPVALERSIMTVTRAWGYSEHSNDSRVIEGIGRVFVRYGPAIALDELIDRLAKFPGGAAGLLGKARGLSEMLHGPVIGAVAEIVVETYNKGRKTRALPPWRTSK